MLAGSGGQSLGSNRFALKYRARVDRDTGGAEDELRHPEPNDVLIHAALPCFIVTTSGDTTFSTGRTAEIITHRGFVAPDADVRAEDRFTSVVNRAGSTLFEGLRVLSVQLFPQAHKRLTMHSVS